VYKSKGPLFWYMCQRTNTTHIHAHTSTMHVHSHTHTKMAHHLCQPDSVFHYTHARAHVNVFMCMNRFGLKRQQQESMWCRFSPRMCRKVQYTDTHTLTQQTRAPHTQALSFSRFPSRSLLLFLSLWHTLTNTHTRMHAFRYDAHTRTHACTHASTHTHTYILAHTHTHTHSLSLSHTHTHTYTLTHIRHAHIHKCSQHAHTPAPVHAHTHTHAYIGPQQFALVIRGNIEASPDILNEYLKNCPGECSGHGVCNTQTWTCACTGM